jgi:hypothetical protein
MTAMKWLSFLVFGIIFLPQVAAAQVYISEIVYDPAGSDTGHEWVEVCSDSAADIANWKFNEANTNHGLSSVQGGTNLSVGGCAVIADDTTKFLADHSGFSGVLFDSSFSLNNTGETLALKDGTLNVIDSVTYSSDSGAAGDGNSLQKINGVWTAAMPTPGTAQGSAADISAPAVSADSNSVWPEYVPPEKMPKIKMEIVASPRAIAGATQKFEGRVYGTKNEPITNARVVWNFGDGAHGEGRYATHTFSYPGVYLVVADAASGEYAATARLSVNVESNALYISEVSPGATTTAWLEIANPSTNLADLSGWFLETAGGHFMFPDNSILAPHSFAVFASENTGLIIPPVGEVHLLYPNGKSADVFNYSGELGEGQTFGRARGVVTVGSATPGAESKIILNNPSSAGAVVSKVTPPQPEAVAPSNNGEQAAAVATALPERGSKWWLWLAASGALGTLGAAAFLVMKHQARKEAPIISKEAAEFEIEEF